ncbi:SH3 domain-containing protein [Brevibacillus choshinensis]|uniref:SH3 domain-containing protein n=1 Tax=Brevibacillus choshinensis TaxID=54911 RepID=UPI002E22B408|nr:SH3 domain-containing protein [Brevibacillus choshinensis]
MVITSYQKSLWVRNLFLVVVAVALVAVAWKISWSIKKIELYDQAFAYYEDDNLISAEQTFSQASEYSAISYGDVEWTAFMSGLSSIRLQLESLSRQAQAAIGDRQEEQVLEAYQHYQSFKQETLKQQDKQTTSFFQAISAHLALEKAWSDYYQQALQQAKSQMQSPKDMGNESFVHTLVLIPDEFFGGKVEKQEELNNLFQRYETAKLRKLAVSLSFDDVITRTANSIKLYRQEGISAGWLQKQLEQYAKSEINQTIKQKDLPGFIAMAKAYRQIKDVLPEDSDVLAVIERHLESRIKQAEQYTKAHQFTRAMELYQELGGLLDTSSLITGVEERWTEYDPTRLLQVKYPDKTFLSVLTGNDHWGAKQYALGVDEKEHRLYLAAKMPDGVNTVYIEQVLDIDTDFNVTLSKLQDGKDNPVILVQTTGKERAYKYLGLIPHLSQTSLESRFIVEADDLSVEDTARVIVKNAVGKGENETASFLMDDKGLEYEEKLTDTENGEPGDPATEVPPSIDVHAGPGENYEIIGQVSPDSSIQVVTDLNGWYQIQFDGKEGWIQAPKATP